MQVGLTLQVTPYVTPQVVALLEAALAQDVLLAPLETSVIQFLHQIRTLQRAISGNRVRYLLAYEVGLGKTIEADLIPGDCAIYWPFVGEETFWRVCDQVVCSIDSDKPIDGRRGWSREQVA